MFAIRVLAVFAACACGGCPTARADEPKRAHEPTPVALMRDGGTTVESWLEAIRKRSASLLQRKPQVVTISKRLDLADTVSMAKYQFPVKAVFVPLPDVHALLVYLTDDELELLRQLLILRERLEPEKQSVLEMPQPKPPGFVTPNAEPKPMAQPKPPGAVRPVADDPGERRLRVYFKDAKWDDVLDWYAKESGLTLVTAVKPSKGTFTFTPPKDTTFTLDEITDIINEALEPQKFILVPRNLTFFIHPTDEPRDDLRPMRNPRASLAELDRLPKRWKVELVIPLQRVTAADLTEEAKRLLGPTGVIVPLEKSNALWVLDTVGNLRELVKLVRAAESRADEPQRKYTVHFERTDWEDILAWYGKITELKADVRAKPVAVLSFKSPKGREFTTAEITDLLNEGLRQQKLLLIPHHRSFAVVSEEAKIDPKLVPAVEFADLSKLARTAIVETRVPLPFELADGDVDELKRLLTPFGEILYAKGKWLLLRDTVGNIARIHSVFHSPDCSDKLPFTFSFKDARWEDVFKHYETRTGLKDMVKAKPTGAFTFVPAKPTQRFTLAEITDILNDALAGQKLLLIRRHMTFVVVPTDKPIDRDLVPRVALDDLRTRGRTELVEAIFAVTGADILDAAEELKKLSGPFGSVTPHKNVLLVRDTAGNIAKMRARLEELDAPKPEKK